MKKNAYFYYFAKSILGPIFKLYYNPKIIGKENIPKTGPIIIAGNHKHLFDQCLAIIATKRVINYMAKKEYFDNKHVAWFFKAAGCIPVDRSKKDSNAKESALKVLTNKGAIGIFPEGTRNRTKSILQPFKFGAVSLASKTNATIVPFAIKGDYKFRSKNLTIEFGKPYKLKSDDLEKENELLYNTVKKMLKNNNLV